VLSLEAGSVDYVETESSGSGGIEAYRQKTLLRFYIQDDFAA